MFEVIFLFALGLIFLVFATIQDFKKKEIANWLNFSLIIFALGFRFFYSLFYGNYNFFYQGLIGFGIFFLLGNFLYYGKMFAGGDAKLMIALGAVLPLPVSLMSNLQFFTIFLLVFLFIGALYSLIGAVFFSIKNFKNFRKEFLRQITKNKKAVIVFTLLSVIIAFFGFYNVFLFFLGVFIFILVYLYLYVKAVDEACMVKQINVGDLSEGDWLYKTIKVGAKEIKPKWEGLTKTQIALIERNRKKILIRKGIAFTPVFLISFLILFYLFKAGSWSVILLNLF